MHPFSTKIASFFCFFCFDCRQQVKSESLPLQMQELELAFGDSFPSVEGASLQVKTSYSEEMADDLDRFLTPRPWLKLVSEPSLGFSGVITVAEFKIDPEFVSFFRSLEYAQFRSPCEHATLIHRINAGRYFGSLSGNWFKSFTAAVRQGSTFIPRVDPAHPLFGEYGNLEETFLPSYRAAGACSQPSIRRLLHLGTEESPLSHWTDFSKRASMTPSRLQRLEKTNEWTVCQCGNFSTFNCTDDSCHTSAGIPIDSRTKKRQDEDMVISRNGNFTAYSLSFELESEAVSPLSNDAKASCSPQTPIVHLFACKAWRRSASKVL